MLLERRSGVQRRIARSTYNNFLKTLRSGFSSAFNLEIGRSISSSIKRKWNSFSWDKISFNKFIESLCDPGIPDEPMFGFVSNITLVDDEECVIGLTCNEDGTPIRDNSYVGKCEVQ